MCLQPLVRRGGLIALSGYREHVDDGAGGVGEDAGRGSVLRGERTRRRPPVLVHFALRMFLQESVYDTAFNLLHRPDMYDLIVASRS